MGAIWFRRSSLLASVSEIVGYKSGLALTREDLVRHAQEEDACLFDGPDDEKLRIRSEEFEELIAGFLYAVGNIRSAHILHPVVAVMKRFRRDREARDLVSPVLDLIAETVVPAPDKPLDLGPFVQAALDKYGVTGFKIAMEYVKAIETFTHASPWAAFRQRHWTDAKDLTDLFESESLETQYGRFLDQRYIDYLAQNMDLVSEINWRKFEGLTAEFFSREGYRVELGPGRNDDGIDVRLWRDEGDGPPTVLVQCKRQQAKIDKMVVKSLFADVTHHRAGSGLIVTTSSFSKGAREVCVARNYPVQEANRESINKWIKRMRTPNAGVFLGE
jgi:restriction system protein